MPVDDLLHVHFVLKKTSGCAAKVDDLVEDETLTDGSSDTQQPTSSWQKLNTLRNTKDLLLNLNMKQQQPKHTCSRKGAQKPNGIS